jgi:hypothetical protein
MNQHCDSRRALYFILKKGMEFRGKILVVSKRLGCRRRSLTQVSNICISHECTMRRTGTEVSQNLTDELDHGVFQLRRDRISVIVEVLVIQKL